MQRILFLLIVCALVLSFTHDVSAVEPTGSVDGVYDSDILQGWAKKDDDLNYFVPVKIYADLTPDPSGKHPVPAAASYVDTTIANKPGWTVNHQIEYPIPDRFKDGKPHFFYAFIINSSGAEVPISGPIMYPNKINSSYYLSPNYPSPTGWTADDTNYFSKWSCSSKTGINTIRRLNIIPLGTHHPNFWKDSTWINTVDFKNNLPVVYFTGSMRLWGAKFVLKKAAFNAQSNKWDIDDIMYPNDPYLTGMSSQDGYGDEYVLNEYDIAGWGPTANKPGSKSKIPGVAETTTPPGHTFPVTPVTYPLVGTGPLGITTITEMKQSDVAFPGKGYATCIHLNPTLFDYDSNGVPHSLFSYLRNLYVGNAPCKLPPGSPIASLPSDGGYVYHYQGAQLGWQLDLTTGHIPNLTGSMNYSFGSNKKILDGSGKNIQIIDLNSTPPSRSTILDCSKSTSEFFLGEVSGTETNTVFLASQHPYGGSVFGLAQIFTEPVLVHDIYYAYSSQTNPAFGAIDGVTSTGIAHGWAADKDAPNIAVHFYVDGEAGKGGVFIGSLRTWKPRPDIQTSYGFGTNSGYTFTIPAQYVSDGKPHKLYGYAIGTNLINVTETNNALINNGMDFAGIGSTIPGDFNSDGHVNIFDYNIVVTGFGTTYTIFDYNAVVENYGK